MALILMVNLAFSIVGFFFIFRMWREVKYRRDEYGENFNIPRAKRKRERRPNVERERDYGEYLDEYEEEEGQREQVSFSEDDVRRMQMLIAKVQQGEGV